MDLLYSVLFAKYGDIDKKSWRNRVVYHHGTTILSKLPQLYLMDNHELIVLSNRVVDLCYEKLKPLLGKVIMINFMKQSGIVWASNNIKLHTGTHTCDFTCSKDATRVISHMDDAPSQNIYICSSCYHKLWKISSTSHYHNTRAPYRGFKHIDSILHMNASQVLILSSVYYMDMHWFHYNNMLVRPWFQIESGMCMWCGMYELIRPSMCEHCYKYSYDLFKMYVLNFFYFKSDAFLDVLCKDVVNKILNVYLSLFDLPNVAVFDNNISVQFVSDNDCVKNEIKNEIEVDVSDDELNGILGPSFLFHLFSCHY